MKYQVVLLDTYSGYIEERFEGKMLFATEEEAKKHAQQLNERKNAEYDNPQNKNSTNFFDETQYGKGYEYVVICLK